MQSAVSGACRTPFRKWPVAISRPSAALVPISGALSGDPGRNAGGRLDQLELRDLRNQAVGLAQQLVYSSGGNR